MRTRNGPGCFRAVTLNQFVVRVCTANNAVHTLLFVVIEPGSDALNDGNRIRGPGLATPRGRTVIAIQTTARCRHTTDAGAMRHEAMLCSSNRGILVWTPAGDIGVVGRNTEGVRPVDLHRG